MPLRARCKPNFCVSLKKLVKFAVVNHPVQANIQLCRTMISYYLLLGPTGASRRIKATRRSRFSLTSTHAETNGVSSHGRRCPGRRPGPRGHALTRQYSDIPPGAGARGNTALSSLGPAFGPHPGARCRNSTRLGGAATRARLS